MKKQIIIMLSLVFCVSLTTTTSYAGITDCGFATITHMYVNGDRDDTIHSNLLLIEVSSPCNGKSIVYIENTSPAYNSFLTTALTAFSTGVKVRIYVNDSKTNQIALIELRK